MTITTKKRYFLLLILLIILGFSALLIKQYIFQKKSLSHDYHKITQPTTSDSVSYYNNPQAMFDSAFYYSRRLLPKKSLKILKEMEKMPAVKENIELLLNVYRLINNECFYGLGDLSLGLTYGLKSLKLCRKQGKHLSAKKILAENYEKIGALKKACLIYTELETAYNNIPLEKRNLKKLAYLMAVKSEVYLEIKEPDKAIAKNHKIMYWLDTVKYSPDNHRYMEIKQGETLLNMAVAYLQKNVPDSVKHYLSLSDAILGKPDYEDIRSTQIYNHQFNVLYYLKEYKRAEKITHHYSKILSKNNKKRTALLLKNTSKLEAVKGNYKKALELLQKERILTKTTFQQQKRQKIISKHVLTSHQETQKEVFKNAKKKQNRFLILLVLIAAGIAIIVFLIFRFYSNKKINNLKKMATKQKKQIDQYKLFLLHIKNIQKENLQNKLLFDKIEKIMHEKLLFLNPNFNRETLASTLKINRQYIIESIKWGAKMNFNNYVKLKRIRFAKKLIENQPKLTVKQVAEHSGYTNCRTFIRHFVEIYKVMPT